MIFTLLRVDNQRAARAPEHFYRGALEPFFEEGFPPFG